MKTFPTRANNPPTNSLKHLVPIFIAPGIGPTMTVTGGDLSVPKLTSTDTGDRLSLAEYTVIPQASPPLFIHEREDEVFGILESEVTFWVNNQRIVAEPAAILLHFAGLDTPPPPPLRFEREYRLEALKTRGIELDSLVPPNP